MILVADADSDAAAPSHVRPRADRQAQGARGLMPLWLGDRGVAFPLALMGLLVLVTLSAALLAVGSSEVQISYNHLRGTQAHFLTEAGLEDAFNSFRNNPTLVSTAPATLTAVPGLSGPGTTLQGFGSYTVQYRSAGSNTVLVVATGTTTIGSAPRILKAIMSTSFISTDAFRTRQHLNVYETAISGTCGNVHANGDLAISDTATGGTPSVTGAATASGSYFQFGGTVGPGSGAGNPQKLIPAVNPSDFLAAAKSSLPAGEIFQMTATGKVLDGNGLEVRPQLSPGETYRGWTYTSTGGKAKWDFGGSTGYDGTYYLEGNVGISGSPGSALSPWKTSIIATGDIQATGNPQISTHLKDTLFVAGLDIVISGTPPAGFTGLIAAHEQVKISKSTITGYILADDAGSTSRTVTSNVVAENATITFDCNLYPPLPGPLQIIAWGP